ncbi:uncharacterized protein CCR75_008063 [Bremia lactucae]|uniref:Uncharacterized protein n=1 Tax=Bremia lactucae TaxID=4779 RepID=A0A976FEE2_BRELC|nr:hypothetical protein CCR75_008063 [Bremia lactucae]
MKYILVVSSRSFLHHARLYRLVSSTSYVCAVAKKKTVKPSYESTKMMVADSLTKVVPAPRIQELLRLIGLT